MEVNDASGNPTRQLTQDQYREWVRQSVSGEIWRKFAAALSIFGITTIFGVWSFTNNVIEDRIKSQTNKLPEEVKGWIGNEITYQVKHNKLVDTAAKQTVTQLTEQRLIDTELRRLIVTQSQNILRGEDPSLRELALQQVLLSANPSKSPMRSAGCCRTQRMPAACFSSRFANISRRRMPAAKFATKMKSCAMCWSER